MALCGTLGLLTLWLAGAAHAERNHAYQEAFGTKGSEAGQLELAAPVAEFGGNGNDEKGGSGVAVDIATHDLYVADTGNHRVDEFTAAGGFIRAFGYGVINGKNELQVCTTASKCRAGLGGHAPGELETPLFIAVDNSPAGKGDVYVGDTGDNLVTKYTSEGALVKTWGNNGGGEAANGQLKGPPGEPFTQLRGITVDTPAGHLWVDNAFRMYQFKQESGGYTSIAWFTEAEPSGITVNSSEELYVPNGFPDVAKYTANGTHLGELFPEHGGSNFTGAAVDTAEQNLFLDAETFVDEVEGSCPPPAAKCEVLQSFGEGVLAGAAGVAVDPGTSVVFVADAGAGVVDAFGLEPAAPPFADDSSDSQITATSVTVAGELDPRSLGGEAETEYYFEYGPCGSPSTCVSSGYPSRTPVEELAPSFDATDVTAEIVGLEPNTVYHYRLVGENAVSLARHAPGVGEERVFSTEGAGLFTLPDNRAWEMVSPPVKNGALIEPIFEEGVIQAAKAGNAITYHANQATEPDPEGAMNQVQILSSRGAAGWQSKDIEPAHGISGKPEGEGEPYRFFSENLQLALVQPAGAYEPGLYPETSEQTPLLRTDYLNNDPTQLCNPKEDSCYRALVTSKPPYTNVPPDTHFGEAQAALGKFGPCPQAASFCGPELLGASSNGEHMVFTSYAQLTSIAVPHTEVYEWNDGVISIVSVLPIGEGGGGAPNGATLGNSSGQDTRQAISPDGSRVIFSAGGNIYLRDTTPGSESTTLIGGGEYQAANSELTKVFFISGGNLYQYDLGASEPTALTENGGVLESLIGTSENGEYAYFVANGPLSSAGEGAITGNCRTPYTTGELCNLYVEHDDTTRLVAVISGEDYDDWAKGEANLTNLTARVSPDGQYLAFMSRRDLVGYNTADALTGRPDEEVYEYDAATGSLACASCEPSGARPRGLAYHDGGLLEGERNMPLVGGGETWEPSATLAANIPGWTPYKIERAVHQSRYLTDEGRLFFNSYDPLVAKDTNGTWDVYEYEPENIGPAGAKCTPAAASGSEVFKPARGYEHESKTAVEPSGCVALISSGSADEESAFLDASETGSDVFFLTTGKLTPQDTDNAYDIYDAHECTTTSPCTTPPPPAEETASCASETECAGSPGRPESAFGPTGSATFTAEDNLPSAPVPSVVVPPKKTLKCAKGKVPNKKRTACIKKAKPKPKHRKKHRT